MGIQDTCLLRPDFYHLTNEVWPKAENFGQVLYPRIKNFLETMLKSTTEAEYTNAFEAALAVVEYEPTKRSLLESIYHDHEYYGGFFLAFVEGNLGLLGSVPAEQNHASIVAHLGDGASWDIANQIQHLMNRQKELTKQRTEKENAHFCSTIHYKSSKKGQEQKDEEEAKKTLSNHAYQKLFLRKSFQGARKLRHKYDLEGNCYVWPAKLGLKDIYGMEHSPAPFEAETYVNPELIVMGNSLFRIPLNGRCDCPDRVSFMFQCPHEYHRDGRFDKELYNGRQWFSRRAYNEWLSTLPTESADPPFDEDTEIDVSLPSNVPRHEENSEMVDEESGDELNHGGVLDDDDNDDDCERDTGDEGRQNYCSVKRQCDELCRIIANDQPQLQSVYVTVMEMIDRLRRRQNIDVYFVDEAAPGHGNADSDQFPAIEGGALMGMSRAIPNANSMKRKRSSGEVWKSNGRKVRTNFAEVGASTPFIASDENNLRAPKTNRRTCSMCKLSGHFIGTCPSLTCYGSPTLEKNNIDVRQQLQAKLTGVATVVTSRREVGGPERVFNSLPTDIDALIVFQRYFIDSSLDSPEFTANYCVECTILHQGGQENPVYTKALFSVGCITTYVVRSKTNIVISLLKDMSGESILLSQLTGIHHSQRLTQLSEGGPLAPMGMNLFSQVPVNHGNLYPNAPMHQGNNGVLGPIGFGFGPNQGFL
jgi:hypothetical protein